MTLEETWLERVLTWRASGLSATAFCEGAEFGAGALRSWSSRFGREGKVSRSPLGRQRKKEAAPGVRFARVVTAAAAEREHHARVPRDERERFARFKLAAGLAQDLPHAVLVRTQEQAAPAATGPVAAAYQPGGDDARIVEDQRVARRQDLRQIADVLPFRYQIGLPVELLVSAHAPAEAAALVARQWALVGLIACVTIVLWRRGVRRFAAYGG